MDDSTNDAQPDTALGYGDAHQLDRSLMERLMIERIVDVVTRAGSPGGSVDNTEFIQSITSKTLTSGGGESVEVVSSQTFEEMKRRFEILAGKSARTAESERLGRQVLRLLLDTDGGDIREALDEMNPRQPIILEVQDFKLLLRWLSQKE